MPSKRSHAKTEFVDIESRLAPFFPQQATSEAPVYDDAAGGWVPPLR